MYYFIGYLRRTFLFILFLLPIGIFAFGHDFGYMMEKALSIGSQSSFLYLTMLAAIPLYPLIAILNIAISRKRGSRRGIFESYFSALRHDLTSPFWNIKMFFLVITRKHIIQDDSKFHNFVDFLQVLWGFVWVILLSVFFVYAISIFIKGA